VHRLETLLAEHNAIVSLPREINILQALRHVSLAYNDLRVFPVELCGIKALDYVDLSHNKLVEVPESVKELNAIEVNLNQNQVSSGVFKKISRSVPYFDIYSVTNVATY